MFVLCTEPALPNLRRIGPQDHFGTNLEPSRLDPIVKVVRKLFRGVSFHRHGSYYREVCSSRAALAQHD
jgi:hypothetical protein